MVAMSVPLARSAACASYLIVATCAPSSFVANPVSVGSASPIGSGAGVTGAVEAAAVRGSGGGQPDAVSA